MRVRTNPAVIKYALYLYFNSRSLRLAAKSLELVKKRSHVAIWKWLQQYSDCADGYRTDRRLVRAIFVDETLLQIDGLILPGFMGLSYAPQVVANQPTPWLGLLEHIAQYVNALWFGGFAIALLGRERILPTTAWPSDGMEK